MLSGALAGLAAAAAAVNLSGQNAADQAGVTFLALGPDGQPVRTLKADQVTVRFNGKARQVASLQLVEAGAGSAAAPAGPAAPASSFPAPFGTNEGAGGGGSATGRVFMLAIDEESLRPGSERPMKEALAKWIDAVPAGEPIGLTTLARGTNNVAPSGDRAAIKAAVDKIVSRQPSAPDCRTLDALNELGRSAAAIGGAGRAAIVMLFTGQITASSDERNCQINTTTFDRMASDLGAANAHLYIVMPEIVSNMDGIQNLAGSTNSPTVNMASGADAALGRILTETSAYYVANFGVEASEKNKPGRLELRAEGVTIRAPKELVAGAATAAAGASASGKANPQTMVRDTRAYTDLPLRIYAIPQGAAEAGKVGVMVLFEPVDPSVKLTAAEVGIVSADNKVVRLPINAAALATSPTVTQTAVVPGKYRIRAAGVDASGRGGAADYEVDLQLTPAGPMQVSGLMLGALEGTKFSNRLQFKAEPQATAIFQLIGTTNKGIDLKIQLFKSGSTSAEVTAMPQLAARQGYFDVIAPIPIANLAPGDYQVKVTFAIEGETPAVVTRTLRKVQ